MVVRVVVWGMRSHYCCCRQLVAGRRWRWRWRYLLQPSPACWLSVQSKHPTGLNVVEGGDDCSVLSWLWRVSTGPSLCWAGSSSPPQRASWTISEIEKISARWVGLNSDWSTGHDSQLISSQVYFLDISTFTQYWVYKGRSDIIFINKQSKIVFNVRKLQYFFISCPHCDSH